MQANKTCEHQRVALVTGANRGIGLSICRQLAEHGVRVFLGARSETAADGAIQDLRQQGLDVRFVSIDTNDPTSFDNARDLIAGEFGKLDILVNNIGIGCDWNYTAANVPMSLLRETFEINFFALVDITQRLLPLIERSPAGRIVNLSSAIGSLAGHATAESWAAGDRPLAYSASKTAVNAFTLHLACALKDTPIKVNAAHPGIVRTDPNPSGLITPDEGARTAVRLALLDGDGPTGGFFHCDETIPW